MSGETALRILNPELKKILDSKALDKDNEAFITKDLVKMFILTMLVFDGIVEEGSDNNGKIVGLLQSTIGKSESEPWCMALIQSAIAFIETFNCKSGVYPSEHCLTVWNKSVCEKPAIPKAGDIVIWQFNGTSKGHAGVVLSVDKNGMTTIEGNTGPLVKEIEREGDGVYKKLRSLQGSEKMRVVGFLRPF